jgi:alpha-tubulin suppressor-like RCC1 family protein
MCATGYQSCDGSTATGCETDTTHSAVTCGSCTNVCHPGDTCGTTTAGACDVSPIVQVAGGTNYVLAVRASGGVAAWGDATSGALTFATSTPSPLTTALSGIVRIDSSAADFSLALTAGRTVLAWGADNSNQLGDGLSAARAQPLPIAGLSNVVSISTGSSHACVVLANGELWCWGLNTNGQLGMGDTMARTTPTRVPGITDAVEVSATVHDTCIRRGSAGIFAVTCWGSNLNGLLGQGTATVTNQSSPGANVMGLPTNLLGLSVVGPTDSMCAVTTNGELYCWGENNLASTLPLGSSASGSVAAASLAPGVTGASRVALSESGGCIVRQTGTPGTTELWCWGSSALNWIPSASGVNNIYVATLQPAIPNPVWVSMQSSGMCAVIVDGTVVCTGGDGQGQLGNGLPIATSQSPVRPLNLP